MGEKVVLPFLMTPQEFADSKNVTRPTVWTHINRGYLDIVKVGVSQKTYIDSSKYPDYSFDETKKRNYAK